MKFLNLFFLSVLFIVKLSAEQKDLIIEKCKLHDEECILKTANNILKKYKEGIKSLNLASIDPFHVDQIRVYRDTGAVYINAEFYKIIVKGLSEAQFKNFKGFEKNLLEIDLITPGLTFSGPYTSKAQILYVPFDNGGNFLINFIKMNFGMKFNLERHKRDEKEFFSITNTIVWDAEDFDLIEPDLGFVLNAFLKSTYDLIKSSLGSFLSEYGGTEFSKRLNEIFSKNSIDDLFLR